ncbi:MAG: UDP-3-O-acyl-N-acetylglucosamine deacetylase [Pseudomonadales bacterium]|nr:UDP-3-O-acyl-N-acetylglucosamine deacetylase [Pseudomonadales bacterium]
MDQHLGQRTIKSCVSTTGIGVHTGNKVSIKFKPASENTGIRFIRTDLSNTPAIKACASRVSNTMLATTLSQSGASVSCIEHLMAALWALGIDNLVIEIDSEEVPIMDGSAAPFIYLLKQAGIRQHNTAKQFIKIKKALEVTAGDAKACLLPYDGFKASYTFVYDHPVFNRYPKHTSLDFTKTSFIDEASKARSFGLTKDLDQAQALNKCLGSSLENAVGIDDHHILNQDGLRYEDEFVKHKILDAIGDLYLLGKSLLGEFIGYKSGHPTNNALARELLANPDAWELVSLNGQPQQASTIPFMQPIAA